MTETLKFKEWELEFERLLTEQTYKDISESGAETCNCNDCKNYIANRDKVFPFEVLELFKNLGVDYKKEVEITSYEILENGLHHIGGWFHFKGQVKNGKDYKIQLSNGGYTIDLTKIEENFEIGFSKGNDLTFFNDKNGLVQIEFMTNIPWIIDKKLEVK